MTQSDWSNFFVAQTGASAALIGLLFVALSINLQRIVAAGFLVDRVAEAVLVFFGLLMFSIFGLVPHQSATTFGVETLGVGIVVWLMTTTLLVRGLRNRPPQATTRFVVQRAVQVQTATLSTIVAGVLLTTGHDAGFFWLVPATVMSYIAGISDAWVLTVEILR
jgi:modulator of FtsH protease